MSPKRRKYLGQIVDRSSSNGLGVHDAWKSLLQENLDNWKLKRFALIRTDKQLTERMRELFPGRTSLAPPTRMRVHWNLIAGSCVYHRYLRDERGRVCMATARGLPLSSWREGNSK
jgi:hypothetical protein